MKEPLKRKIRANRACKTIQAMTKAIENKYD